MTANRIRHQPAVPEADLAVRTEFYPGGTAAVHDLNLKVRRGEVLGLLGPNGAGKQAIDGVQVNVRNHLRFPDVPALLDAGARDVSTWRRFFSQAAGKRGPVKCTRHWFPQPEGELAVQADGTVVPCCLAHNREISLGDLSREPLDAIWRGERFAALRRALIMQGDELGSFTLCQRCNFDLP